MRGAAGDVKVLTSYGANLYKISEIFACSRRAQEHKYKCGYVLTQVDYLWHAER